MAWMKKVYLAAAVVGSALAYMFPNMATELLAVAVFLSIFSLAGGLDLSERIETLESELKQLKSAIQEPSSD
jgi:hypothetical protein